MTFFFLMNRSIFFKLSSHIAEFKDENIRNFVLSIEKCVKFTQLCLKMTNYNLYIIV